MRRLGWMSIIESQESCTVRHRGWNDGQNHVSSGLCGIFKSQVSLVFLLPVLPEYPITAFGISHLLYAVTYTLFLYHSTSPPPWTKSLSFQSSTLYLVVVFTMQGIFKHILSEGDRIVLTSVSDHYHQGVYAMGSAYEGMAA